MHVAFFDPPQEGFCHLSHGEKIFLSSISVGLYYLLHIAWFLTKCKNSFISGVSPMFQEWPKLGYEN